MSFKWFLIYHFTVRWSVIFLPIVSTFRTLYCPVDFICIFRTVLKRSSNFPNSGNISVFVMVSWNIQKKEIILKLEFLRIIILYVKTRSLFFFIELNFAFINSQVFCIFVITYLKWPSPLKHVVMRIKHWQRKTNLWMKLFKSILLSQRDMKNKVCSN
jgi:hypothetical protein